jgi:hypothetical protein
MNFGYCWRKWQERPQMDATKILGREGKPNSLADLIEMSQPKDIIAKPGRENSSKSRSFA